MLIALYATLTLPAQVLYLTDPIDEAMVTNMAKFGEYELVDVSKEGLQLDDSPEEAKKNEEVAKEFKAVADFLKKSLGDKIEKVTVSDRYGEICIACLLYQSRG